MSGRFNKNSLEGGYCGNNGSMTGSPVTYTTPSGRTDITPHVNHTLTNGSNWFGGGVSVDHRINSTSSVHAKFDSQRNDTRATIGFKHKF